LRPQAGRDVSPDATSTYDKPRPTAGGDLSGNLSETEYLDTALAAVLALAYAEQGPGAYRRIMSLTGMGASGRLSARG